MPSSASVRAEPRWARITTRPLSLRATCTATAPEVVRTFRTYATARNYPPSTPNSTLRQPNPQATEPTAQETSDHVRSQAHDEIELAALKTAAAARLAPW